MEQGERTEKKRGLMELVCQEVLPNCDKAMQLAEAGIEKPLGLGERIALAYHGQLCPFCSCARGKFDASLARMNETRKKT